MTTTEFDVVVKEDGIEIATANIAFVEAFDPRPTWKWLSGNWFDDLDELEYFTRGVMIETGQNQFTTAYFSRDTEDTGAEPIDVALFLLTASQIAPGTVSATITWESGSGFLNEEPISVVLHITPHS